MREKVDRFLESYEKEQYAETFEDKMFIRAQWWLAEEFDIENLSTIELSHLRRITKEVIVYEADVEKQSKNVQTEYRIGSYDSEIGKRWLWDLYGINMREEQNNKELISRIRFLREQAHNPSLA